MMKLLDTKHNWLLMVFHKNLILIYEKTYSMVLNAITLQYLIILVAQQGLHLHLMMMLQPISTVLLRMIFI